MTQSFDQVWSKRTKDRVPVSVCFDRALLGEFEIAEQNLKEAKASSNGNLGSGIGELQAEVAELRGLIKKATVRLVFENIGMRRWRSIMAAHPPTNEQKAEAAKQEVPVQFNIETFPAAAMAASCVEPGLSIEQAQEMMDELPETVFTRLWVACLNASVLGARDPLGPDFETPTRSTKRSKRPSGSASPAQSSSGEQ